MDLLPSQPAQCLPPVAHDCRSEERRVGGVQTCALPIWGIIKQLATEVTENTERKSREKQGKWGIVPLLCFSRLFLSVFSVTSVANCFSSEWSYCPRSRPSACAKSPTTADRKSVA